MQVFHHKRLFKTYWAHIYFADTVYDEREGESFCVELEDFSDFEGRMARISEGENIK